MVRPGGSRILDMVPIRQHVVGLVTYDQTKIPIPELQSMEQGLSPMAIRSIASAEHIIEIVGLSDLRTLIWNKSTGGRLPT